MITPLCNTNGLGEDTLHWSFIVSFHPKPFIWLDFILKSVKMFQNYWTKETKKNNNSNDELSEDGPSVDVSMMVVIFVV